MERTAVWKWRELKRGEEEINEIIGRAGGQSSGVGPYTVQWTDHTHTPATVCTVHTITGLHTHAHHSGVTNSGLVCVCVCGSAACTGCWVVVGWCRGYGDKLRCPVTSIWGGLGLVCRAPLEVICCRISDGLEMGLEREFMPPITEKREGYPERMPRTKQLTRTFNAPEAAALPQIGKKNGANISRRPRSHAPPTWLCAITQQCRHSVSLIQDQ